MPVVNRLSKHFFKSMSVHNFVAHFLKENGYHETLRSFEAEHGKKISSELSHEETLEDIIADRLKYLQLDESNEVKEDIYINEAVKEIKEKQFVAWSAPYPQNGADIGPVNGLVVDSTIVQIGSSKYVVSATASKALVVIDLETKLVISKIPNVIGNVVVRRITSAKDFLILCGMNGRVSIGKFSPDFQKFDVLSETQVHPRLVTDIKVLSWQSKLFLVSVGWDFFVKVHEIDDSNKFKLHLVGYPYKLSNQASCIDAVVFQNKLYVLVCKREITLMDVICLNDTTSNLVPEYRIALNDAEFSASGFTPMSVKILYKDSFDVPLVAVGTSHEPHMRVIVVSMKMVEDSETGSILRNKIMCNLTTSSPQDKYSDAEIEWRPDGSGIWIVGDDGMIRGIDLLDGSIAVELKGHEGRIKCVSIDEKRIISCGTDRKVMEWT